MYALSRVFNTLFLTRTDSITLKGSSSFTFYRPMMDVIDMGEHAFRGISYPLVFFNITANIFYAWSLFLSRGKLKQPLKVLLGFLVFCTIIFCVSFIITACLRDSQDHILSFLVFVIMGQYTNTSMTCYVWLNFYYYVSIVPPKRVLTVWTKKNIKSVIYVALIGDTMLYLVNDALTLASFTNHYSYNYNISMAGLSDEFFNTMVAFFSLTQMYLFFCVWIMMVSSFSTVHYLWKHIRNLAESASCFTSPKIQSQIRVTVAGLLQGLFYLVYFVFYLTDFFTYMFHQRFLFSSRVSITATTLFLSATTVNMGISQTVIRQRAADVFRGLKVLCLLRN